MRRVGGLILLLIACLLPAGCASERMLRQSGKRPPWADTAPPADENSLYFTGTALGRNVLDEREMRIRAMEDARQQIASRIATAVSVRTREVLRTEGDPSRGADEVEAEYRRELRTRAEERLHGVRLDDAYWEKWRVDPGPFSRAFTRYKYYALAAYPKTEYERQIGYYVRLTTDRARARELIEQGRPRRAAELLEGLLSDYPDASVEIRLTLARAYERADMPDRAVDALRGALDLVEGPEQEVRVRERLRKLEAAFPDLSGRSAVLQVRAASSTTGEAPLREWGEEALLEARIGVVDAPADADWLVEAELKLTEPASATELYGIRMQVVRVEAVARVRRTADGELLATGTASATGRARERTRALRSATRAALRAALRRSLLQVASDTSEGS